jgi:hydroxyethylthiazole kinase-like sugar kinase family protein
MADSCGQLLLKYFKTGRGRLIKCYLDQVREDYAAVAGLPLGARPACPACGKELGVVQMIHSRPALKINHGTVKETRI